MGRPRMLIVDTYYPDFLKTLTVKEDGLWLVENSDVMRKRFGTSDFYSRNLEHLGWDVVDVVANCEPLQRCWSLAHGYPFTNPKQALFHQVQHYNPDVIFFQDLSFLNEEEIQRFGLSHVIAGQCSCPMPPRENLEWFDVIFTSFPHYVEQFEAMRVKGVYNPLAFEPTVLLDAPPVERDIDCAFVGGVGTPSHWAFGMEVLEAVAREVPTAQFWGYGYDLLPDSSEVKKKYRGPAWGVDMYKILARSKVVVNRHGEVARNYANNMKLYETTGMGALLLTDLKSNLKSFFEPEREVVTYVTPQEAARKAAYYVEHWDEGSVVAERGQRRTLRDHTYAKRMRTISDSLMEMLS